MASGISVKLPLVLDEKDGAYKLNKTIKDVVKQNFKNLMLTSPGERIMDPRFGVGLRRYFFENNNCKTQRDIKTRIYEQVAEYMPFLGVDEVRFGGDEGEGHVLRVAIFYRILSMGEKDVLTIDFNRV